MCYVCIQVHCCSSIPVQGFGYVCVHFVIGVCVCVVRSGPWLEACPWRARLQRGQLTLQTIKTHCCLSPRALGFIQLGSGGIAASALQPDSKLNPRYLVYNDAGLRRRWRGRIDTATACGPVWRQGPIIRTSFLYHLSHLHT